MNILKLIDQLNAEEQQLQARLATIRDRCDWLQSVAAPTIARRVKKLLTTTTEGEPSTVRPSQPAGNLGLAVLTMLQQGPQTIDELGLVSRQRAIVGSLQHHGYIKRRADGRWKITAAGKARVGA